MGIELPAPQNEQHVAPRSGVEHAAMPKYGEIPQSLQSAEIFTTERPSASELKTGVGAGNGAGTSSTSDASATTQTPSQLAAVQSTPVLEDIPVVAADEDLIEKQWVDSVKRAIKDTRTDPYTQSAALSRLQADYLQKRYGKTIGQGNSLS